MSHGLRPSYQYSEKDWNPISYEEAANTELGPVAYCASKALAERAMWDWTSSNKNQINFTLTTINPPWVFGPYVGEPDLSNLSESMASLWGLVDAESVPPTDFAGFVDVRDVAQAVLSALINLQTAGRRFLLGSHFDWQTAADILRDDLRERIPELRERIPKGCPGFGCKEEVYMIVSTNAEEMLAVKWTPLHVTLYDALSQLLQAEVKYKSDVREQNGK